MYVNPKDVALRLALGALLLGTSSATQAALTVYTSLATFQAATSSPGVDTYFGFLTTGTTPSPITRAAGPYSYRASTSTSAFFGAGTVADPALSTDEAYDTVTFNNIGANVRGIAGNFFGSDNHGVFAAGSIIVKATDGSGNVTQTIVGATPSSFLGFVSTGPLTSLEVTAVQPAADFLWPTIDNFTLALAASTSAPATLSSAVSRKVHGAAGSFDLPLTLTPLTSPTTEPRQGSMATVVLTFDKPIASANAAVTEGGATAAAPTLSGNDVNVALSGLVDAQYVTLTLTNVAGTDGSTGGTGVVRIGFLVGDVNQSRVVSLADLGLVNAQLAQPVTAANYLKDVNANGTLTLADKGITNASLTHSLPPP